MRIYSPPKIVGPTQAWTKLRYHDLQSRLWRTRSRWVACPCGRGSGKTEILCRYIVRMLPVRKPWSDPLYFLAGPTYGQVKRVLWQKDMKLVPTEWIQGSPILSEMRIDTIFGSSLLFFGLDQPQRAEGLQYDGGGIDESSDIKPRTFELSLLPALSHRNGWCWRIGVPKRFGIGAKEYRHWCERKDVSTFSWPSRDILPQSVVAEARKVLDDVGFREQFEASWEDAGGLIFYGFDREASVRPCEYSPERRIYVGCDFNVDPMSWVLGHIVGDKLLIFDELWLRNTNTRESLNELHRRYRDHRGGWYFVGDASARARKTSASKTDYLWILKDDRFTDKLVRWPRTNPPRTDRFESTNALFMSWRG